MLDVDALLRPWLSQITADVEGLELLDAHTHIGRNDPDGFRQEPAELVAALESAEARGVVFPMHEPDGYPAANDAVLAAAAASDGRLVAFARVDPANGAPAEARRCLDAGARGIKLHPRAERFTLGHPRVRDVIALADERRVPVLIHAGRGIPALGPDTVELAEEFPRAQLILAHAAVSDLAWLWRVLPGHPNVFVDTSWWNPVDLCALLALAPPGQILWASDSPYGLPVSSAVQTLRCARQVGLTREQLRSIAGGQLARLLEGAPPQDAGAAPGPAQQPLHPLLERVVSHLTAALSRALARADFSEPLALSRLACAVGVDDEHADVCSAVLELLDLFERHLTPPTEGRPVPPAGRLLVLALHVARTPDVPLGPLPESPAPTREQAEEHEPAVEH